MYSGIEQVKPGWTAHQSPNWGIITIPAQNFAHTAWPAQTQKVGQGGYAQPARQQAEDVEMKE